MPGQSPLSPIDTKFEPSRVSRASISGLEFATVRKALVYPNAITSTNGSVRGGIAPVAEGPQYLFQNRYARGRVVSVTRFRHSDPTGHIARGATLPNLSGQFIYLGPIHRHFGHFITETMTRIWLALCEGYSDVRILALPEADSVYERDNFKYDSLLPWQKDIFEYFGINDIEFVGPGGVYEEVLVPEQAAILFSDIHPAAFREILTVHKGHRLGDNPRNQKVFYLRPKTDVGGRFAGETYIANYLTEFGYQTVSPEELSGSEQLKLAASCDKVISAQGSALHSFNLLGNSEVDCMVIQRSTASVWRGFLKSFEPYVRSVERVVPEVMLPHRNEKELPLGILDMSELLSRLEVFDPSIDAGAFDWKAYDLSVLRDLTSFCN